jgi:hypothetical protein
MTHLFPLRCVKPGKITFLTYQKNEDENGGACNTHGRYQKGMKNYGESVIECLPKESYLSGLLYVSDGISSHSGTD